MAPKEKKQVTYRIDAERLKSLKKFAIDQEMSIQELLDALVDRAMESGERVERRFAVELSGPDEQQYVGRMLEFRRSTTPGAVGHLEGLLAEIQGVLSEPAEPRTATDDLVDEAERELRAG